MAARRSRGRVDRRRARRSAALGGSAGEQFAATAGRAFTDALGLGLTAAAAVALVGALLVAVRLPSRAAPVAVPA